MVNSEWVSSKGLKGVDGHRSNALASSVVDSKRFSHALGLVCLPRPLSELWMSLPEAVLWLVKGEIKSHVDFSRNDVIFTSEGSEG